MNVDILDRMERALAKTRERFFRATSGLNQAWTRQTPNETSTQGNFPMTSATTKARRFLSGVQPTGKLHLGNYFGAIKQHIASR